MPLPSVLFKILNPLCLLNATCLNQRSILFLALVVNLAGRYYEDDLHPKYCSTIDLNLDQEGRFGQHRQHVWRYR